MQKIKMALKNFLTKVTKADTWLSLWSSITQKIIGKRQDLLPVPVVQDKTEFGTLTTPDGSYLRFAKFYRTPITHKGTILVLTGRREFIEEYQEINTGFQSRDYKVWTFDWRGQGASKRFLADPDKGHIDDYKTYLKDLDLFVNSLVRKDTKAPFYIFAHSMGGHILLRYLLENRPSDIAGVILSAPMVDIRTGTYPYRVARGIARAMTLSGASEKYIFGENGKLLNDEDFDGNPFTHDPERFLRRIELQRKYQEYVVRGYTFGWLEATFRSIKQLHLKMEQKLLDIPLLLLSPENDPVVKNEQFSKVLGCFKNSKIQIYPNTGHCLLDERLDVRQQIWKDIDFFLKA